MTQCVDLRADASIRKAAIAAGDSRIIGLASRDLVAAKAWYHVSAIEIIPDLIKHASIHTWMISLTRMKPSTVI